MDSPCESESSLDGGAMLPPSSPGSRDQLQKRIDSLMQQNRVYKVELETYKIRVKVLQEENRALRQASVIIQAKAEQEEEYISNTLLKKIQALKKEKETLAHQYEREEECLTNELTRKLDQLRQEKCKLEQTLEQEQECLVNKLMRKIEKLEADTLSKQTNLEQLRREKIELENTLEQEQEALVNKLWKRMDKLESEKRSLQIKLDQPVSDASNTKFESDILATLNGSTNDTASNLSNHIRTLRSEIVQLRSNLENAQKATQQFVADEKSIREENMRLQRKLQMEVERREALCRHLSESESSLEMEEERLYHESLNNSVSSLNSSQRQRTISSPVPHSPSSSRPISPGSASFSGRCCTCGQLLGRRTSGFIKPAIPLMGGSGGGSGTSSGNSGGGPPAFGPSGLTGAGFMGSNRNSVDGGAMIGSIGGGGGAFSPNHSQSSGGGGGGVSSGNVGTGSGLMHTFLQPASPMDTSVYKE